MIEVLDVGQVEIVTSITTGEYLAFYETVVDVLINLFDLLRDFIVGLLHAGLELTHFVGAINNILTHTLNLFADLKVLLAQLPEGLLLLLVVHFVHFIERVSPVGWRLCLFSDCFHTSSLFRLLV